MSTHNPNPGRSIDERLQFLLQSAESHDQQIGKVTEDLAVVSKTISDLATAVGALLLISKSHKDRLDVLERGNS